MCLLPGTPASRLENLRMADAEEGERGRYEDTGVQTEKDSETGAEVDAEEEKEGEIERKKKERAEAAERWRAKPGFLVDEVTITRLDEAEGIAVMISDWLELDAEDDGIRHDAEIVCSLFYSLSFKPISCIGRLSSRNLHMRHI